MNLSLFTADARAGAFPAEMHEREPFPAEMHDRKPFFFG